MDYPNWTIEILAIKIVPGKITAGVKLISDWALPFSPLYEKIELSTNGEVDANQAEKLIRSEANKITEKCDLILSDREKEAEHIKGFNSVK